ncbi:MAG: UDP-N-acetylmuramoyl-L-alanyl-D-glutamate--2,6-diaminopimelate ligase [Betaproteobacteria bacterium]
MSTALVDAPDVAGLLARLATFPRRITADSRRVEAGVAFAAYPGLHFDGRVYIPDALQRGASAVLWDSSNFHWRPEWDAPNVGVDRLQQRLGSIADFIYGSPSKSLWMTAITGTNGKTSSAQWIAQALEACGRRAAVLGTLGNGFVGALAPSTHTTPDITVLHEMLAQFHAAGASSVAMEVSSHGLEQGRVNGVQFDIALFTNLSRDHLDYHGTMAAYGAAKARLFSWPGLKYVVINADDPFGQSLIESSRARGQKLLTYGTASTADVAAVGITMDATGMTLDVVTPWGRTTVTAPVVGAFNAQNLLGVLTVLLASDVSLAEATRAMATLTAPPGRMQRLGGNGKPLVVIDYAHTPDALDKALTALRPAVSGAGEIVCVFGCGGDRDPGKRPEMGRIAARLAHRVVVTSDNPRNEEPAVIATGIIKGIREIGNRRWALEPDRAAAIREAIATATAQDLILIAGKGHETYQERNGVRTPFSDAAEAAAALAHWGGP